MSEFDLNKFRNEFLKSDGWQVSDCYKTYDDKFLRKDAQDAYEGAKWAWNHQQKKIDDHEKRCIELAKEKQDSIKKVDAIKQSLTEIYDACDDNETVSMLLDKIQEILK